MDLIQDPSPNHSPRRDGYPFALVIHIEGGSEQATDDWFDRPDSQASAHFSVARDGTQRQHVDVSEAAWSNGIIDAIDHGHAQLLLASIPSGASPNRWTVSIEHEGDSGDPLQGAQFAASVELAVMLFGPGGALAGQPCDRDHVLRHSEIGSHPLCPGYTEDNIARYIAAVNAVLHPQQIPVWAQAPINAGGDDVPPKVLKQLDIAQADVVVEVARAAINGGHATVQEVDIGDPSRVAVLTIVDRDAAHAGDPNAF